MLLLGASIYPRFDLLAGGVTYLPRPVVGNPARPNPGAVRGASAGASVAAGTLCVVPLVGVSWAQGDPVPAWALCDNNWQGEAACEDAFMQSFSRKDWRAAPCRSPRPARPSPAANAPTAALLGTAAPVSPPP